MMSSICDAAKATGFRVSLISVHMYIENITLLCVRCRLEDYIHRY
jgi:hypothetical protein